MRGTSLLASAAAVVLASSISSIVVVEGKLADRSRIVQARQARGGKYHDNGIPIEGPQYRHFKSGEYERDATTTTASSSRATRERAVPQDDSINFREFNSEEEEPESFRRRLSSQLTGCCYNYQSYSASSMCSMYGQDCESGETPSHDSGDDECEVDGLSFIGLSFSVNTANGNPYSYQLCDQFPMENIIDRDYSYVMSMDEDGWLVGGGYKTFDYSGKMPYIDSSHTEILRIGNMDPNTGGTSIDQVYAAMESVSFPPIAVYPEYLKGGGGHHSGDDDGGGEVPSSDVTLIVSVVESYEDNDSYSTYEMFLDDLFQAFYNVGGGACMDDKDTDPHVSMARGVKFWSSYHAQQYMYETNLEVAVWQAMYPEGVVIGSSGSAAFPPGRGGSKQYVGYGNLYFFFDRANITRAFSPARSLTSDEEYYSTLYMTTDTSSYYSSTTSIGFDYSGSNDGGGDFEHNPYNWNTQMAFHDMTDGWLLPPNCFMEGETFFGIPLSRSSDSKLQSSNTFQEQFDFEYLVDRNNTFISSFGTNHGWLVGEELGNAVGSIVDKDTAHIPLFYLGTTNPKLGGMSLGDMIKVAKSIDFGKLYIKPAFVFVDQNGHVKLQFEADASSALGYLYDALCKELGITWNNESPSNSKGLYTNCAMHSAGDRAKYGCGPDNANTGGFCPQMTIAYSPRFMSEEYAAAYLERCNNYVDYWRSLFPSGVAVGTSDFCSDGGCLGLFLNRYDLYTVFKPDLGGSWVEYNGASMPPTYSPAPTWQGGCDEPHNFHLDKCFRKRYKPKASAVAWDALGSVGQFSVLLVMFMALTLAISVFVSRARRKKRRGESYLGFFFRDMNRKKKKKRGKKIGNVDLEEAMLPEVSSRRKSRSSASGRRSRHSSASRSRSKSKSRRKRSKSRSSRGGSRGGSRSRASASVRSEKLQTGKEDQSVFSSGGSTTQGVFDVAGSTPQASGGDEEKRQQLV